MIQKTRGVVLSHIKYGDSSVIVRIYTEQFGTMSFIVNSVRSKKARSSMAYFQPLSCLDLVIYHQPNREIHRISEFKSFVQSQPYDIRKQTILLFLSEVMDRILRNEHTENSALFNFIVDGIRYFNSHKKIENFHVQFLLKSTAFLGINISSGEELFENMNQVADRTDVEQFTNDLLSVEFDQYIESSGQIRMQTLEYLITYFQHHLPGFGQIQSLKVLDQIFR